MVPLSLASRDWSEPSSPLPADGGVRAQLRTRPAFTAITSTSTWSTTLRTCTWAALPGSGRTFRGEVLLEETHDEQVAGPVFWRGCGCGNLHLLLWNQGDLCGMEEARQ